MTSTFSHAVNRPGANFEMEASHVWDLGCFVFMASSGVVRMFLQSM